MNGFTSSSFSAIQDKTGLTHHSWWRGIVIDTYTRRHRVVYNEKSRKRNPRDAIAEFAPFTDYIGAMEEIAGDGARGIAQEQNQPGIDGRVGFSVMSENMQKIGW